MTLSVSEVITMITVKVYFSDGDNLVTSINGCLRDAMDYYLDHWFNLGTTKDRMVKAIYVQEI